MAARPSIGDLVYEIRIPVLLAVVWAVLGLFASSISGPIADLLWFVVRVAIVAAAGYLVTRRGKFGLGYAALAGALVMLADHVLVKGTAFVLDGELGAAFGVLVSFVMFVWVAALIGVVGGVVGRMAAKSNAAI
jgi:hypothetical protein